MNTDLSRKRVLLMSNRLTGQHRQFVPLLASGCEIVEARDEIEAFTAVKSQLLDAAILHLPLNETADMDLPAVLRGAAQAAYLPVIILADDAAEQDQCAFLDSGADDVIFLDTRPAEALSRVRALIRVKDLQDRLAKSRAELEKSLERERQLLAALRRDNARLRSLATTDPLTRVQNLRSYEEILEHEFKVARRYKQPLSLLTLDVDHFKVVNDVHGHPSGDYVLKETAVILTQSVRDSDVVARTGGEEFTIILPKADCRQARQFAERIRREVCSRQFAVYGSNIHITVSVGTATYGEDAEITDFDMLAYCADQALLISKDTGRDRVVSFCDLNPKVRERLRRQYLAMPQAVEDKQCEASGRAAVTSSRL